jgi:hypothetical protein
MSRSPAQLSRGALRSAYSQGSNVELFRSRTLVQIYFRRQAISLLNLCLGVSLLIIAGRLGDQLGPTRLTHCKFVRLQA